MIRISKAAASEMVDRLRQWQSPNDLRIYLDSFRARHGFRIASQRSFQPWREMHCALQFATAANATAMRLGEDPPDFWLRRDGEDLKFELVEVRQPDERPGEEFDQLAELASNGEAMPPVTIALDDIEANVGKWVARQIAAKARKGYGSDIILAVKIHAWILDSMESAVRTKVADAAAPWLSSFRAIWIDGFTHVEVLQTKEANPAPLRR